MSKYNRNVYDINGTEISLFPIQTILSFTTGHKWKPSEEYTEKYGDMTNLMWYIYNNDLLNGSAMCYYAEEIRQHLLNLYPELEPIVYPKPKNQVTFEKMQKEIEYTLGIKYDTFPNSYKELINANSNNEKTLYYFAVLDYLKQNNVPIIISKEEPWNALLPITRMNKNLPIMLKKPSTKTRKKEFKKLIKYIK